MVKIYIVRDGADAGGMPEPEAYDVQTLRFQRRTVGVTRFWAAAQENIKADLLIRCPLRETVSTQDVAVLPGGRQYAVRQVQVPEGVCPPVMDLTLERTAQNDEVE